MSRECPSPTCPIRARWNLSLTDMRPLAIPRIQFSAAAGQTLMLRVLIFHQQQFESTNHEQKSFATKSSKFLSCVRTDRIISFHSCPRLLTSPGPTPPGNRVVITQVIWDGQHPVMDNPYYRTQEQVDALVNKAGKINAAIGIKLMGLSHLLKQPIDLSEHLR